VRLEKAFPDKPASPPPRISAAVRQPAAKIEQRHWLWGLSWLAGTGVRTRFAAEFPHLH